MNINMQQPTTGMSHLLDDMQIQTTDNTTQSMKKTQAGVHYLFHLLLIYSTFSSLGGSIIKQTKITIRNTYNAEVYTLATEYKAISLYLQGNNTYVGLQFLNCKLSQNSTQSLLLHQRLYHH